MRVCNVFIIVLLWVLLLAGCGGKKTSEGRFAFLDSVGVAWSDALLLGDTLALPDVYSDEAGGPGGVRLTRSQYRALVLPAGEEFADEMSNWLLLGVKDMGGGVTLAAYYACNGIGYCVDLLTHDRHGRVLDAMNARELHLLWRTDMADVTNDTVFTLDGCLTFAGERMTLHRTMGQCVMDFEAERKGAPLWRQQWDQEYVVNAKGHFVLQGQRVVAEQGVVDRYAALDFKSWDMLICSRHDPGVMDTWNEYGEMVRCTYDPDYQYNPFPWDVAQLYKMNPGRFLRWAAVPQHRASRLMAYFKLKPAERPALLREVARLDDPGARAWLTALVNSWDDRPLTRHH